MADLLTYRLPKYEKFEFFLVWRIIHFLPSAEKCDLDPGMISKLFCGFLPKKFADLKIGQSQEQFLQKVF